MTSNRSSAQPSPSRGGSAGEPGPSAPPPDRQTHSTHIFEVPYRKAAEADRPKQASRPSSPPTSSQQPASSSPSSSNNKPPPKITPIPRIVPTGSLRYDPPGSEDPPPPKPRHETLAQGLEGRYVDEFGNVLDWDGTVLGRVEGDLPSMVGRPVSQNGEILDTDGDVVGYVSDNYIQPERQELGNGLQVDGEGNIYNQDGAVIGKLNEPPNKDAKSSWPAKQRVEAPPPPPKPASAPNPSEIYLDVKSTFDGIQIIIKIPTIFNREHDCAEHDKEKTEEERVKYEDRPRENGDSSHHNNPMSIPGGWKKDTPRETPRDTPAQERSDPTEAIPRSATGLVSDSGLIIDHEGRTIGKLAESEDARSLVGNTVTAAGDVVDDAGETVGRASLGDDKEKEYTTGKQEATESPKVQEEDAKSTGGFFSSASSLVKQGLGSFSRSKKNLSDAGQEAAPDAPEVEKAETETQANKSEAATSQPALSEAGQPNLVSRSKADLDDVPPKPEDDSFTEADDPNLKYPPPESAIAPSEAPEDESRTEAGESLKSGPSGVPDVPASQGARAPSEAPEDVRTEAGESLKSVKSGASKVPPSQGEDAPSEAPADESRTEAGESQKGDQSEVPDVPASQVGGAPSGAPEEDVRTEAGESLKSAKSGASKAPPSQGEGAPSESPADDQRTETGESLKGGQSEVPDVSPSQAGDAPSEVPEEDVRTEAGESFKGAKSGVSQTALSQGADAPSEVPEGSQVGDKSQRDAESEVPNLPSEAGDAPSQVPDELRTEAGESRIEGSQDGPVALEDREDDQKTLGGKTDASADKSQVAGTDVPETIGEGQALGEESKAGEEQALGEESQAGETQEGEEGEEAEKLDYTILKGAKVNKVGNLVNDKGEMVGRVIEGNVKQLLGKKADEEGNIWNDSGKIVGKGEPISQAERDDHKDYAPFENFPDAVVESDGRVTSKGEQVGIVVEGDPKRLKGSKVDEDGDILDRNGNVVGKAEAKEKDVPVEEEPEKTDTSSLKNAKVNKVGNLVDSKGEVVGKVIEGNIKQLQGRTCDENGDIWDSSGKIIGKGEPLTTGDRDEQKDFAPFENFPNAIVEADGRVTSDGVQVGVVVQGDPKRLKGSKVDEDGDILDRNGNVVGKAEPWDEPEAEAEKVVDRSCLAGKRVNKRGNVVDSSGVIYGRVIEGNVANLVGRMCDKEGNVRSESGDIIGKAEIVSEGEREGSKDGPFAELSGLTVNKDGKVVTAAGDVVGRLISGDPKVLAGRSVDEDGDIMDRNGNVLGKAERWEEPEVEKKKDPLAGRRVNREGNVVDDDGNIIGKLVSGDLQICSGKEVDDDGDVVNAKGHTIGHVSLLENIPPEPEPEHVETEEERKAREEEAKQKAEDEKDRKLAGQLGGCIEQSLDKIRPLCKLITDKIDSAERTPKEDLDEEALVREVKPLIEEGGKILSETNGMIRGLDPDGRIQRQAKQRSGTREATPEEHHLAEQLKELTGTVTQTIDNAKRKIEGMPHAKKELNPLWGLLMEPLGQILAAVGLLLNGVLGLVGRLLSGLGLAPLVDNILGGLGLNKILGSLGLGSAYDALLGKDKKDGGKKKGILF
ncbi:unnamed protein product [Clonostachys rhizophaga]|uniref:DUF6987 domain-containing protein n=1 Tax=Clonostachys rhizophaga TaxID=160324 RepID=A0A9N9VXB6_9HYPO|nr:unnamed protein product [Clonostachys rhizophaga]